MGIKFSLKKQPDRISVREQRLVEAAAYHALSVLVASDDTRTGYAGNPYVTYSSAVEALAKKYEGTAEWGVQQARNVIDVRSAFIIGQGLNVIHKDGKKESREMEFIQDFIDRNDLDEEMVQEFAKEAEIEGKFLCQLSPSEDNQNLDLRYVSWTTNKYEVIAAPEDYKRYEKVTWRKTGTSEQVTLDASEFVYKKFGGRVNKVNDIMPKVSMVNKQMENLDKALWDWRKINHLFAAPTPHLKVDDEQQAEIMYNNLNKKMNWKVGKLLVSAGEFSFVGADMQGIDSLEKEIVTLAKIISGATGVPVHFLGLPDLMSNRAVSTDLFELINASTSKDRKVWVGAYEEIFKKALTMANERLGKGFDPDVIEVDIPQFTSAEMKALVEVWLPLYQERVVNLDYMLSMIPGVDSDAVKKAQTEEASRMLESLKAREQEEQGGGVA